MLEARSVALVGASMRAASFGSRMLEEVGKSSARPRIYPVNPRYADLGGARPFERRPVRPARDEERVALLVERRGDHLRDAYARLPGEERGERVIQRRHCCRE